MSTLGGIGCLGAIFVATAIPLALEACSHRADDRVEPAQEIGTRSGACGQFGLPDCPLQGWMKANMTPAMSANDAPRLQRAFARVADLGPAGYATWRPIALQGEDAASRGDVEAARRACKECHDEHRPRYRSGLRARSLP